MFEQLREVNERLEEIVRLLSDAECAKDPNRLQALMKEQAGLLPRKRFVRAVGRGVVGEYTRNFDIRKSRDIRDLAGGLFRRHETYTGHARIDRYMNLRPFSEGGGGIIDTDGVVRSENRHFNVVSDQPVVIARRHIAKDYNRSIYAALPEFHGLVGGGNGEIIRRVT